MTHAHAEAVRNIKTVTELIKLGKILISYNYKNNIVRILVASLLIASVSGCGFWTNFKTYFNTYYNANKIFEESEKQVFELREDLFAYEEIPITKTLSKDFDLVIEKTSAILQHNKESDYIPEALLMTGKSFYYQQNYSRALRKFNELATRDETELQLENKLWIGKTYLQMREFDKALNIFEDVENEAKELEEEEVLIELYKSYIGYLIYAEDYTTAVDEINEFFNTDIDDELRAEVLYELGRMYKLTGNYPAAAETFLKVSEYSPTFEVDFNSKFESAKLKGEIGQQEESLILLNDLRDEDKFSDNWGDIDLEIGKIFYDRNEIEEAFEKFTEVDTTYRQTESASIAGFYRAEILENHFHDYDSALGFYKTASTSNAPQKLRDIAKKKSRLLNQYIGYHTKLTDLRKQYLYLTDENAFIQDSLDYELMLKQDSIKAAENQSEITRGRGQRNQPQPKYKMPIRPKIPVDSIRALNSKNYFELANLLFAEFNDPDSAYYYYRLSLEEDPENPNEAQTYYAMGNYFLVKDDKERADSMFTIVYDKFEFNPIRNEAAKQIGKPLYDFDKDPVEDEYVEAEALYESKEYNNTINKLFEIYKNNPKSIYASKSLYTIGFILEYDLNMPDSAASVYDTLSSKYATSEYSKAILAKLNAYKNEQSRLKAIEDSANVSENENELEKLSQSTEYIDQLKIDNSNDTADKDLSAVAEGIFSDGTNYFVQVSSWLVKADAEADVEKLKNLNYSPVIISSFNEDKDETQYNVRVGPYQTLLDATKVKDAGPLTIDENKLIIKEDDDVQEAKTENSELKKNLKPEIKSDTTNKTLDISENIEKEDLDIIARDIYKDGNKYYVQVSFWKTKKYAISEVEKYSKMKYNAFIFTTFVKEKNSVYHRVRIGPFKSFLTAKNIREKINKY